MSQLLNNAVLIYPHVVSLTSHVSILVHLQIFMMETAEDIASCVYHWFRTMPAPTWLCDKDYVLIGTQMGVAGPVFSYKLRSIVGFWLVEMAISTNRKPTIYRNLYENTAPDP